MVVVAVYLACYRIEIDKGIEMNQDFWNEPYKGDPDQAAVADHFLEEEEADLPPGTAVDLGCGADQNALMLASNRMTSFVTWRSFFRLKDGK